MTTANRARPIVLVLGALLALGACSGGTTSSASSAASAAPTASAEGSAATGVCADAAAVKSSLADLQNLDLMSTGKEGLTSAFDEVEASVSTLATSAKEAAGPEVDALKTALATLKTAVGDLSSDAGVIEKATEIKGAVSGVETAATALKAALKQCQ